MRISDWSSDVCSSDLHAAEQKKSSFALEHAIESTAWRTPRYIAEGLRWLAEGNPAPVLPPEAVAEELVAEVIGVEVADGGQPAQGRWGEPSRSPRPRCG